MQNVNYTEYSLETGEILSVGSTSGTLPELPEGMGRIEQAVDMEMYYIDVNSGEIEARSAFPIGEFVGDIYHIPLPVGTELLWQGELYVADNNITEILVDQPSAHLLILTHPHYLKREVYIENPNAN
mgnify:CR=1 FL=1